MRIHPWPEWVRVGWLCWTTVDWSWPKEWNQKSENSVHKLISTVKKGAGREWMVEHSRKILTSQKKPPQWDGVTFCEARNTNCVSLDTTSQSSGTGCSEFDSRVLQYLWDGLILNLAPCMLQMTLATGEEVAYSLRYQHNQSNPRNNTNWLVEWKVSI